ncbi:hypothetical protein EVA_11939 [gut metagenome]|uniref:Uncharacterized protein n=1 Tax=gut metagenome TaxID=749906 RepID=J9GDS4_9ZZZZ
MQSAAEAEPFFKPLDSVQTYKGSADAVVEKYRMFLSKTLKSGISGKSEMLAFIKEEDRLFRSFLSHLPELADADLSVITRDTEKCCLLIFSQQRMAGSLIGMPWYIQPGEPTGESYSTLWLAVMTSTKAM